MADELEVPSVWSPFLHSGETADSGSIAVLHLRRDQLLPTLLNITGSGQAGYAEGSVTNTQFGSYPHSTIIGLPWGSQILASKVDTGTRGRQNGSISKSKKRKLGDGAKGDAATVHVPGALKKQKLSRKDTQALHHVHDSSAEASDGAHQLKSPITASTGFCHLLAPTPESWTVSLPHRTQVVYTPDYSYVLQKLQARPGSILIEAGAGSGSFTHAAVRTVFNGYPDTTLGTQLQPRPRRPNVRGKVYSFEFHEQRAETLAKELDEHGLSGIVQVSHRDVYKHGFLVSSPTRQPSASPSPPASPNATQVFLDLPAPWEALPHLTRAEPSPLDATKPIHLCIFLPCMEQVQRAVAALRAHGWVEINMQHLAQRRLEVRRERVGLDLQGMRGVNASPATVDEAVEKLIRVERAAKRHRVGSDKETAVNQPIPSNHEPGEEAVAANGAADNEVPMDTPEDIPAQSSSRDGRLVHRTEPEIKTHTSYLVFAILPRQWYEEDEIRCAAHWSSRKSSL